MWRCSLGDVGKVIREGVMLDAHPPLSTLFLFYWTKFFGVEEWIVKLPFIVMGIVSVFLVFRVGVLWFSKSCGLMAAAWFAVLKESVMHSQIARPYIMGVMWVLLAAVLFHGIVKKLSKPTAFAIITYGLALALCAYTHHFAMLAAALLWLCGLIFFRNQWRAQMMAGVVAVVCYLPNLGIVLSQLKIGGIGTVLAPPPFSFLPDYLYYVFHFSWWLIALVVIIAQSSIFFHQKIEKKFLWLALIMFFGTLAVGFSYSHLVAPVLQTRVMFFVLPFFLLALFAFINPEKFKLQLTSVIIILFAGSFSLVVERKYYDVFYKNGFYDVMAFAEQESLKPGTQFNILALSPFILDYQKEKQGLNKMQIVNPDSLWTMCDYQHLVDTCTAQRICFGWTTQYYRPPIEFIAMVIEKYPVIESHENWFNSSAYVFAQSSSGSTMLHTEMLKPCEHSERWKVNDKIEIADTTGHCSLTFLPTQEFGLLYESPAYQLQEHRYDLLYAKLLFRPIDSSVEKMGDALLVMEVLKGDSTVHWNTNNLSDFVCTDETEKRNLMRTGLEKATSYTAYIGCYSPDVFRHAGADYNVRCYVWNRGSSFAVSMMEVGALPGNPLVYGLMEKLE